MNEELIRVLFNNGYGQIFAPNHYIERFVQEDDIVGMERSTNKILEFGQELINPWGVLYED